MAPRLPAPESVELGDQCEKMLGGGVQVRRQRGDFVPEVEEIVRLVVARVVGHHNLFICKKYNDLQNNIVKIFWPSHAGRRNCL